MLKGILTFIQRIENNRYSALLLWLLGVGLCFWKLGASSVEDWDEARRGMNALGMMERGDYLRLYYGNGPDVWAAKPPLAIWSIIASYKIFGFNEFALRFHSALSISLFLGLLYLLIKEVANRQMAFWALFISLGLAGFIGFHVGRNGDTDGLLTLLLTSGTLFLFKSLKKNENWLILSALFFGLAFYTKGPATFLYIPGVALFCLILKPEWLKINKRIFIASVLLYLAIVSSWLLIQSQFGHHGLETTAISEGSTLKQMLIYDVVERFSNPEFDKNGRNLLALFPALDTIMGLWSYVFYLSLIIGVFLLYKTGLKNALNKTRQNPFFTLSVIQITIICLIYIFSASKHRWYLSPFLPFFIFFILFILKKAFRHQIILLVLTVIGLVSFILRFLDVNMPSKNPKMAFNEHAELIATKSDFLLEPQARQAHYLYLKWINRDANFRRQKPLDIDALRANEWAYIKQEKHPNLDLEKFEVIEIGDYALVGLKSTIDQ